MMEYTIFYRESNNFDDIMSDPVVKKQTRLKIRFKNHLILDLADDKSKSYMLVKYGDDVITMTHIAPDRSPIPYKDYFPIRKTRQNRN